MHSSTYVCIMISKSAFDPPLKNISPWVCFGRLDAKVLNCKQRICWKNLRINTRKRLVVFGKIAKFSYSFIKVWRSCFSVGNFYYTLRKFMFSWCVPTTYFSFVKSLLWWNYFLSGNLYFLSFERGKIVEKLVAGSVCVCVCVCVCLYSSTVKASPVCKMSKTYLKVRMNDLVLWIFVDCVMPSSIIAVSENVIFHLQRRKLQQLSYWREKDIM